MPISILEKLAEFAHSFRHHMDVVDRWVAGRGGDHVGKVRRPSVGSNHDTKSRSLGFSWSPADYCTHSPAPTNLP